MRSFLLFCVIPLFHSSAAHGDDKIVVTATRNESTSRDLPFSVDTVSGERWEQTGGQVEKALSGIPGISVTSNGGPGQTRSLFIRGSEARHTLVLIDGIPVNDPLSPSRTFDFGQIPVDEIDRIEVIKGPQSVLYGSNAMGGVVQIFTRKEKQARARAEGGSYSTVNARLAGMGFRAGVTSTRGFSAADERDGNTERDGHYAWNIGGTKDFAVSDHFLMRLDAQYKESKTDTDARGGPGGDSRNTYAQNSQFLLREENTFLLPQEAELSVAGSYSSHDRDDKNTTTNDFYKAYLWKVESILKKPNLGVHSLTAGLEYGEEAGRSSQTTGGQRRFRMGAAYLQDQLGFGRFHAVAGARLDLHSETKRAGTYRLGLGYWLVENALRAKASIGTGFAAPSLYQTYSIYGSPQLRPEKSVGGDAGLELTHGGWRTELTFFANRFRDLIDYDTTANRYFNLARAETYGLEWSAERRFGRLTLTNALTWMRAVNPGNGFALPRRPRVSNTLSLGWAQAKRAGANLAARYVGTRLDSIYTRQNMPAFWTLGFDMFHSIGEGLRLVARGENLLDRHYQEVSGFGVPALSGYAGLEADL